MAKNKSKPRGKKSAGQIILRILLVLVIIGVICGLALAGYVLSLWRSIPDITVEDLVTAQTSFVYDEDGQQIATLNGGENRVSINLDEMPQHLIDALIASEDIRFYKHNGVDLRSVIRAVFIDLRDTVINRRVTFTQGASTITMQLVKNVVDETEKTLPRKIKQALLAIEFEKDHDKDEILYYYLNEIYMGGNAYGVQAGSNYYFNKDVSELTLSEAATLIAVLRSPGYYSPYSNPELVIDTRNAILNLLLKYKPDVYTEDVISAAQAEPLTVSESSYSTAVYEHPWFVDYVIDEASDVLDELGYDGDSVYTGGWHIYTTMDENVQSAIETVYANDSNFPSSNTGDIIESAMAIVDPYSGAIKGLVGGRVYSTRRGFNRATDLIRSPGSTIKPLVVYAPAIEQGYGANTVIDDSPFIAGSWSPNNDDRKFLGRISLRTAVMRSRNVCAVKVLAAIGTETGYEYGLKLGLPLTTSDSGNLSMALGGINQGVSPLEMASAFGTFANSGVHVDDYCISRIEDSRGNVIYTASKNMTEVFSAATAYVMTDILCSAVNGGTGTAAKVSGWQTAGKTGTNEVPSEDPDYRGVSGNKDVWFCGYTTALSGAVWMGYDNKKDESGNIQYMSIYGGSYPAQIFNKVMSIALQSYENKNFTRPAGVYDITLDTKTGKAPTELTPAEYTSTDMFSTSEYLGFIGEEVEWANTYICLDTNKLAGASCFNIDVKPLLRYVNGDAPFAGADENLLNKFKSVPDFDLYAPLDYCTPPGDFDINDPNITAVYVCTDPRHGSELRVANRPGSGYSGGCGDYIQLRYFSVDEAPVQYCDLSDHQLYVSSGDGNGSTAPLTPTGLMAYGTESGIMVSWDSAGTGLSYVLERYDAGTEESMRKLLSEPSYLDTDVVYGKTYSYRVYSYNRSTQETSDWTDRVKATY